MKIEKYKKTKNSRYEIIFENGKSISLYEEVILKYELLLKKEVDAKILLAVEEENKSWDVYYNALKQIKTRPRSALELKNNLLKKEFPQFLVEKEIEKLITQGYLNDKMYAKSYTHNQIITTSWGPKKIEKELLKKGIAYEYIKEALEEYTEEVELEKINKIVTRMIKSNRSRSNSLLKQKILTDLINQGYDKNLIISNLSLQSFNDDKEIIKKEYDKLYKKLSRKYSGEELKYKLRQKMYQKGLHYEE